MREKVVELLAKHCAFKEKRCVGCDPGKYYHPECKTNLFGKIADDLISNGVTIQKWIPVTERLPNICEPVLVCCDFMGGKAFRVSDRYGKNGMLWTGIPESHKVTHWMPLPEAPKEGVIDG